MRSLLAIIFLGLFSGFAVAEDKTELILKQLTELQKSIDTLNKSMDARTKKVEGDVISLQQQISKLQSEIDEIKRKPQITVPVPTPSTRPTPKVEESGGKTENSKVEAPPVRVPWIGSAKVIVNNTWTQTAYFTVNGLNYTLQPGASGFVEVPAGTFQFQVSGVHAGVQTRAISSGETYTITVHPLVAQRYNACQ
jgi:hypothetical protein